MPFANIGAARDAIQGHFNTRFSTLAPGVYVAWPDTEAETPQDREPWVRVKWVTKQGFQATINSPGNRRFRTRGSLLIEVRTPQGDGLTVSDTLVDNVQTIFEGQEVPAPDSVLFRGVTPLETGPDGVWFLVTVQVDFEYDRLR